MAETGRKILAVDDESALLDLVAAYLTRLGHQVECSRSAPEALALFRQDPSGFALLITDVQLPGVGGPELAAQARKLNPQVSVLLTSGYPTQHISLPHGLSGGVVLLQKPFSPSILSEAVRSLLGPADPTGPR